MFRTDLLSIIRSLNTVFTAIGICHTGYVAVCCSSILTSLQTVKIISMTNFAGNTVLTRLMIDSKSVRNM